MTRRRPRREANSAFPNRPGACRRGRAPQAAAGQVAGGQGVTQALLTASGFITNPGRTQGGHLWWRRSADGGSVCIGTVIMWVQYNTTAAKTWQVTIYSARHPAGLIVASRTFSLKRGWYWWGFG